MIRKGANTLKMKQELKMGDIGAEQMMLPTLPHSIRERNLGCRFLPLSGAWLKKRFEDYEGIMVFYNYCIFNRHKRNKMPVMYSHSLSPVAQQ